jgi:hypothetical protein
MPKPLNKPQPTSSVANLLEPGVAAAALAPTGTLSPTAPRNSPIPNEGQIVGSDQAVAAGVPTGELANITRQFILTSSTDETLKRLLAVYSRASGANLTNSHVLRAILKAVSHAMPELEREATRLRALKRPSNARGKEALREEFEKKLATAFVAGMRAAAVYE